MTFIIVLVFFNKNNDSINKVKRNIQNKIFSLKAIAAKIIQSAFF